MPVVTVRLFAELDGRPIEDLPLTHTWAAPSVRAFSFIVDDAAAYQLAEVTALDTWLALVFYTSQAITVRLNGQNDAGIPLKAGGVIAIVGTRIDTYTPWTILNNSGQRAIIRGVALGSIH